MNIESNSEVTDNDIRTKVLEEDNEKLKLALTEVRKSKNKKAKKIKLYFKF